MESKQAAELPQDLADAEARVSLWRTRREKPGRMPEDLWAAAVRLARRHGINRVARTLKLDYYSLKRRFTGAGEAAGERPSRSRRRRSKGAPPPAFVEVEVPSQQITPECVLELVGPRGAKMTLRVRGSVDVVALAEAFWRRRR